MKARVQGERDAVLTTLALLARVDEAEGWTRRFRDASSVVFTGAPGAAGPCHAEVALDPEQGELTLRVVVEEGRGHDEVAIEFAERVLGPIVEATGARLCARLHTGLLDLVPPELLDTLTSFATADVSEDELGPDDELRFLDVVSRAHLAQADALDGRALARWLADAGWPTALTARLARDLDRGRALLEAYDGARVRAGSRP